MRNLGPKTLVIIEATIVPEAAHAGAVLAARGGMNLLCTKVQYPDHGVLFCICCSFASSVTVLPDKASPEDHGTGSQLYGLTSDSANLDPSTRGIPAQVYGTSDVRHAHRAQVGTWLGKQEESPPRDVEEMPCTP